MPFGNLPSCDFLFTPSFMENYYSDSVPISRDDSISRRYKTLKAFLQNPFSYPFGEYAPLDILSACWEDIDSDEYFMILRECWNEIVSPEAMNLINLAKKKAQTLGDFVVIHIRSGDVVYGNDVLKSINPYQFIQKPLSPYLALEIIDKERQKGRNVVLFSDDLPTLQALKQQNNQMLKNNENIGGLWIADDLCDSLLGFERRIFEVILMSEAQVLYSSGESLFSRLSLMIGEVKSITVNEFLTPQNQYEIIKEYLESYRFHSAQEAFAYLKLWDLGRLLSCPVSIQKSYIQKASFLSHLITYKVLYVFSLLENQEFEEANSFLSEVYQSWKDEFIQHLLSGHYGNEKANFLFAFTFLPYFASLSVEKIPYIAYFKYVIALGLKEKSVEQIRNVKGYQKILNSLLDTHSMYLFCQTASKMNAFGDVVCEIQSETLKNKIYLIKKAFRRRRIEKLKNSLHKRWRRIIQVGALPSN